jgi:energy-coupling factor transporter ATP-binding protein EcfA2
VANLLPLDSSQVWSAASASVVFVTHDLEEAISLADKVCVITAGPGTVKGIYTIDLPRPRNVTEIRFEPRFVHLYHQIWEDLRNEVLISTSLGQNMGRVGTLASTIFEPSLLLAPLREQIQQTRFGIASDKA